MSWTWLMMKRLTTVCVHPPRLSSVHSTQTSASRRGIEASLSDGKYSATSCRGFLKTTACIWHTWRLMGTAARGGSPALMHFRCLSWRSFPAFIRFVRMFPSALHVPNGRVYRRHVDPHPHQVGVSIVMVDVDPHTPHVGRSVYCISQVRRLVSLVVSLFRHIPDVQIRLEDVTC